MAGQRPLILSAVPILFAWCLTGCATMIYGTTQRVPITSEPPGMEIVVNGQSVGSTPMTIAFPRDLSQFGLRESRGEMISVKSPDGRSERAYLVRGYFHRAVIVSVLPMTAGLLLTLLRQTKIGIPILVTGSLTFLVDSFAKPFARIVPERVHANFPGASAEPIGPRPRAIEMPAPPTTGDKPQPWM